MRVHVVVLLVLATATLTTANTLPERPAQEDVLLPHTGSSRQLTALGWGHFLSPILNTLVSSYTKSALEGRAAAVRDFLSARGMLPGGNGTQPLLRSLLPQMLSQLRERAAALTGGASSSASASTAAAAANTQPAVNVVQLPSNAPSSGINVRTRTPVDVEAPVKVSNPSNELLAGNNPKH